MKKIIYALLLVLCLSIVGCQKEIPTELNVSPTELSFENVGDYKAISIRSNKSWTISSSAEWCKVSPTQGKANGTISVSCDKNETFDDRNCTITIKSEELSKTVTVKQNQADGLLVEQKEYEVSEDEQTLSIKVKSNIDYNVTVEGTCKWISVIRTKALSESTVEIKIEANDSGQRGGKITIGNSNVYDVVTITQESATFVEFEDANFKAYCVENFDSNGDSEISKNEAENVEDIFCDGLNISSLKGVEHFSALTDLECSLNQLTSLDVSKNTALTYLGCGYNQLTSLDVSKNTALTWLTCHNNQLTSLDVSKNTILTHLVCDYNQLTSLDVSKNTALAYFDCYENQLTSLDVSKNTALIKLICGCNKLTSLDVSKNPILTYLTCSENQLTSLDVSKNTILTHLVCVENQISTIYVWKGFFATQHPNFLKDYSAKYVEVE